MTRDAGPDGVLLSRLVTTLGERLLQVRRLAGADPRVTTVVIAEPGDRIERADGAIVLLVGVRGVDAAPAVRAFAAAGPAAIAVKGSPAQLDALDGVADAAGARLLGVHPDLPWHRLESLAADVIGAAPAVDAPSIDLFTLAETVARLSGGPVSIEDAGSAVLAYSSSGDEVDDLRRLSILGRQGPRGYLDRLAALGVYDRLRSGRRIVHVAEHPELNIKARTAIGVRHSGRYIGTVWVQGTPPPDAEAGLLGAVRLIGALMAGGHAAAASTLVYDDALARTLDGDDVDLATIAGVSTRSRVLMSVLQMLPTGDAAEWGGAGLARSAAVNDLAVRAASYRKIVLITERGGRIAVGLLRAADGDREWMAATARSVAAHVRRGYGVDVAVGIGDVRPVSDVRGSFALAGAALDLPAAGDVVRDAVSRSGEILLAGLLTGIRGDPEFRHPGIARLLATEPEVAASLLDFLTLGGFAAAADKRGVHVNTMRYRVRRAGEITGLDMSDGDHRLIAELLLRARTDGPAG